MKYPTKDFKVGDVVEIKKGTDDYVLNRPGIIESINPYNQAPFEIRIIFKRAHYLRFCSASQIVHSKFKEPNLEDIEEEQKKLKLSKLANKIRSRSRRKGLTVAELCKLSGADHEEFYQLSNGYEFMTDESAAKKIAKILHSKYSKLTYLELLGKE